MKKTNIPSINSSDLVKTSQIYKDISIAEIHSRLDNKAKSTRFNLEQKVLILKLLQLNEMNFTKTGLEVGIRRETLYVWRRLYGAVVFTAKPEIIISETIETDLAVLQAQTMRNAYRLVNHAIYKLDELISNTSKTRDIYAVSEAVKTTIEVIKVLLPEVHRQEKLKASEYFFNKLT